jgi:hypothetical protein
LPGFDLLHDIPAATHLLRYVLLLKPADTGSFLDRYVVAIGLAIVLVTGLLYLLIARPGRHSDDVGEGDAVEVAARLRSLRAGSSTE